MRPVDLAFHLGRLSRGGEIAQRSTKPGDSPHDGHVMTRQSFVAPPHMPAKGTSVRGGDGRQARYHIDPCSRTSRRQVATSGLLYRAEFLSTGDPVISVDSKKKELVGQKANRGTLVGFGRRPPTPTPPAF